MEADSDTCPKCKCESWEHEYLGAYNVRCVECGEEWNLRVQLGLPRAYCACCGNTLTWGCGHTHEQEAASIAHRRTHEHYAGECEGCFTQGPGYLPPPVPNTLYATHAEWIAYLDGQVEATA